MKFRLTETILERTAKVLTEVHNIKVEFKADATPSIIGDNTILLPSIPEGAPSDYIDALQGYLDRQASKIIYSTTKGYLRGAIAKPELKNKGYKYVFDVVESVRVERRYTKMYPGADYNLFNAYTRFFNAAQQDWGNIKKIHKVLIAANIGVRYPESFEFQNFKDKKLGKKINKVIEMIGLDTLDDMEASIKLSEKITKYINSKEDEEEEDEQPEKGKSDGKNDGDDEDDKNAGEGEGEGEESSITSSMDEVIEKAHADAKSTESGTKPPDAPIKYIHPTRFDRIEYKVYTTKDDTYNQVPAPTLSVAGTTLHKWRNRTDPVVHIMRTRLVNSFRVKTARKWQTGKYDGKLDVRRAYRSVYGISDAVYKQRTKKLSLDVAVGIALDHSGSMHHGMSHAEPGQHQGKMECAAQASLVLGDLLSSIGIPFQLYGFTTRFNHLDDPGIYGKFDRASAMKIDIYSGFGQSWKDKAPALTLARAQMENIDGEAVLFGVRQLLNRKEKRKILFVLSDGQPAPGGYGNANRCGQHLHQVALDAEKAGVQVIAIGIDTDAVKHYYKEHVVIQRVEDLLKEPLNKLDKILRKAMMEL